jgi:hypothetical protein
MDLIESNLDRPLSHWYYSYKFDAIFEMLRDSLTSSRLLVDVGAGSAIFSKEFTARNLGLNCVAIDTGYEEDFMDLENRIYFTNKTKEVSGDLYLFTDVLEHVPNERDFLKLYVDQAPLGAKFVFTVPAHMSLWSGHDVYLRHFRRYEKEELIQVLKDVGLNNINSRYLYSILFPFVYLIRKLPKLKVEVSQMSKVNPFFNALIKKILWLDKYFSKYSSHGISIIAFAEKR